MVPQLRAFWAASASSATAAGTMTSAPIDTLGFDWTTIDILASTQAASTPAGGPSVLKLQECETTVDTSFVDIVGFRGGPDFVIGIGSTSSPTANAYKFNVDCRGRLRYLRVVTSPTTTQTFNVLANLGRREQSPSTATMAGVLNLVEG